MLDDCRRLVLPYSVRSQLNVQAGDELYVFSNCEEKIVLTKKSNGKDSSSIIVDELGRVTLPKELCTTLELCEQDSFEVTAVPEDGAIILYLAEKARG